MFSYSEGPYQRFSSTRSRILGSAAPYGVAYPSPFFDVAHTYLPDTVKRMFRWCRYYYLTNPVIAATINKMAEYPITDISVATENEGLREHWETFFEDTIKLRSFLINLGLYYMCYGNAIVSIHYPFVKFLKCRHCSAKHPARDVQYRFHGYRFVMKCPSCGNSGEAIAEDVQIKSPRQIRLIIWNPEDITVVHNDITGEDTYFYEVPKSLKNDIQIGKPHIVQNIPQLVIDAVRKEKLIRLNPDNVFHSKRPSLLTGVKDAGMGIPMLLPVLKDVFYLQILKKANEAIALERVYPLSVIFPASAAPTADVFNNVNLMKWRDQVQQEIARWRVDRAYIPVMPLPLGHQVIGGDGRALMLGNEIKMWSDQIIAGMGVPNEFVYGGLQYSGSNVSLRMLEKHFLRYISDLRRFVRGFLIKNVAAYLDWPVVEARFKPFKMADDLQRKALMFQYNQAGKVSDATLLTDSDLDPTKENEAMERETDSRTQAVKKQQLAQAEIQGEAQVVMAKFQARSQTVMNEEMAQAQQGMQDSGPGEAREGLGPSPAGQGGGMQGQGMLPPGPQQAQQQAQQQGQQQAQQGQLGGAPPQSQPDPQTVQAIAQQLAALPQGFQEMSLQQLAQQNPLLAQAVAQVLRSGGAAASSPDSAGKPLPEQLPPRRGPESASI